MQDIEEVECVVCHGSDFEIIPNTQRGFVVLCNECGYASAVTLAHLQAG